jgi:hypothetical protein
MFGFARTRPFTAHAIVKVWRSSGAGSHGGITEGAAAGAATAGVGVAAGAGEAAAVGEPGGEVRGGGGLRAGGRHEVFAGVGGESDCGIGSESVAGLSEEDPVESRSGSFVASERRWATSRVGMSSESLELEYENERTGEGRRGGGRTRRRWGGGRRDILPIRDFNDHDARITKIESARWKRLLADHLSRRIFSEDKVILFQLLIFADDEKICTVFDSGLIPARD